jgi:hypothetical protein
MTPAWKGAVIEELARRDQDATMPEWFGRARMELARRVGAEKSAIGKLLKPETTSSALVPKISKVLGIAMPVLGTDEEIAEIVSQLDDEGRRFALELLRRLVK